MKRFFRFGAILGAIVLIISCSRGVVREEAPPYEQFQKAMQYYNDKDYLKAQGEFQRIVYSFPGQPFIDTAQFYLSMSYFAVESYPEAIGEFKRLLQAYPVSPFADDAQYHVGLAHYNESPRYSHDQSDTYAAVDEFSVFLDRFSSSPFVEDVNEKLNALYDKLARKLFQSGHLYLKLNDFEPALIYFEQVRDNYPRTEWAAKALYYAGEAQLNLGRQSDALETFQNFIAAFPDHKLARKAQNYISKLSPVQAEG